jgi:hypothetical protein
VSDAFYRVVYVDCRNGERANVALFLFGDGIQFSAAIHPTMQRPAMITGLSREWLHDAATTMIGMVAEMTNLERYRFQANPMLDVHLADPLWSTVNGARGEKEALDALVGAFLEFPRRSGRR